MFQTMLYNFEFQNKNWNRKQIDISESYRVGIIHKHDKRATILHQMDKKVKKIKKIYLKS